MTRLLDQALARVSQLPDDEQDAGAALILAELEDEDRWNDAFASSTDHLAALADEALTEHRRGETQPFDPRR